MMNAKMRGALLATASASLLAACGANDIASPGTGGNITINNPPAPAPPPPPPPSPTPTPTITPAAACPGTLLAQGGQDAGTITNPDTGTYRVCSLPSRITANLALPKISGLIYQLSGRVDVGTDGGPTPSAADTNVTLTIDPGVILFGGTGVSWLAVNRGNRIQAVGTPTQPIIFTSRSNILGINDINSSGQWGGVVLLGRAPITDCAAPGATPGTIACERQTEGAVDPALYGGATANDNSGRMSYVQIRYSGFVLSSNSELQSLTPQGVGSATILDHIMSYNSSDDGVEAFGGRVHLNYFVSIGAEDDNLDTDVGTKANFQFGILVQRAGVGDAMVEADSDNSADGDNPRQNTLVSNFTHLQRSIGNSNQASILLRGGTDYTLANTVLDSTGNPCIRISRTQTASTTQNAAIDEFGAPRFLSVAAACGPTKYIDSGIPAGTVATLFGTGANNNNDAFTLSLTSLFINGANETAVTPFNAATLNGVSFNGIQLTRPGFFQTTSYIGAVRDANDTWYQGWTCNSATADLGPNNSSCLSLPTT